jgi:hypothetical protein
MLITAATLTAIATKLFINLTSEPLAMTSGTVVLTAPVLLVAQKVYPLFANPGHEQLVVVEIGAGLCERIVLVAVTVETIL